MSETVDIPMVDIEDLAEEAPSTVEPKQVEPETKEQPKRKPGRPIGAKSKEPGKPRAPRKKRVEIVEEKDEVEQPRVLPGSKPIPTHSHNDTTVMMLQLLQHQAHQRQRNKADLWKSWFR